MASKPPATQGSTRLDPQREADLMDKWLENQRMEMEIQKEQMLLKNREIDTDKSLAEKSIDAQLEDRSRTRVQATKLTKYTLIFFGVVIFMLLIFGGYVISKDKEAVLSELMALFIELCKYGIGAVTGYFIAKAKFQSGKNDNSDPD